MNKTVIFIVFSCLAGLGLIGSVILLMTKPEATATFTSFVVQTLGIAAVAAGTFYGFGKTAEKLETVERQTNGTLSALREENDRLTRENVSLARQLPSTLDAEGHGR